MTYDHPIHSPDPPVTLFCHPDIFPTQVARLTEWNSSKSGQANGIMGFFMGKSPFTILTNFIPSFSLNTYSSLASQLRPTPDPGSSPWPLYIRIPPSQLPLNAQQIPIVFANPNTSPPSPGRYQWLHWKYNVH